jgi:hypothetical protein
MAELTSNPNDPRLGRGVDKEKTEQHEAYLVLPEEALETTEGYVRPVRTAYRHLTCGCVTTMSMKLAQTYARNPKFYGATYCVACQKHLPVGEFVWDSDGEVVGS